MFNSPLGRFLISFAIAAPIAILIFLFMSMLIAVNEISLEAKETRVLSAITPQANDSDVRTRQRAKPQRIDSAKIPGLRPAFKRDGTITAASSSSTKRLGSMLKS